MLTAVPKSSEERSHDVHFIADLDQAMQKAFLKVGQEPRGHIAAGKDERSNRQDQLLARVAELEAQLRLLQSTS